MDISRSFTIGHSIGQNGNKTVYKGTTETEGLAIGQKVSSTVLTEVEKSADKMVISDQDDTPNLQVNFRKLSDGVHLEVTNTSGEFVTRTSIPVELDPSEVKNAQNLEGGFEVNRVTVEQRQGFGTIISLADNCGVGERPFWIVAGKLNAGLRDA